MGFSCKVPVFKITVNILKQNHISTIWYSKPVFRFEYSKLADIKKATLYLLCQRDWKARGIPTADQEYRL